MKVTRSGKVAVVVILTLMVAVPLWQLGDHAAAGYYSRHAEHLYDHVSNYLVHDQPEEGVGNSTLHHQNDTRRGTKAQSSVNPHCRGFPNTDAILLVMKTGATEIYAKMPTQLLTAMSCLPDFLLYSDSDSQIGPYHFTNALDRVDDSIKNAHKEFELYDAQQRCPISRLDCAAGLSGGWELDKYKFLNMVERTWQKRPGMDWYVFAEADTYIVWSNLVKWLRERAPRGDAYVGSAAMVNGFPFAHGGSGYVVSGSLMKKMAEGIPDLAAKYDERATQECCGDVVLSHAIDEAGTQVMQAHPMFNGEKPITLPYGPGHWCEPILTMHHVNPEEVSMIWQYEQSRRNRTDIMLIKDIYQTFMAPYLVSLRRDWDNRSEDTCYVGTSEEEQQHAGNQERHRQKHENEKNPLEKTAHESPSACAKVCEADGLDITWEELAKMENYVDRSRFIREHYAKRVKSDKDGTWRRERSCFQWRYQKGTCCTSKTFRFGATKRESNDEDRWTSGWFVQGIEDWIEARGECKDVEWKEPYHVL